MKTVGIVAGGPKNELPSFSEYLSIDFWIGVDEGCLHLKSQNINPDLAVGDFDSMTETELSEISQVSEVLQFPNDKDQTDLEIGIDQAIKMDPDLVLIFGATGGRLDHEWMNINLLKKFSEKRIDAWMINKHNELTIKYPDTYKLEKDLRYKYISFLPMTEKVEHLSLKGFRYELEDENISSDSSLTVSNEWNEKKGTYSFSTGILLVVKSRD
ncbi:thiamine diphosphokinase [Halalkalibacillus sediminis]|uniref:Thiamine diphosphokinase n=1 Tax=Halalkalibacillus sediminis TaxID=2018042 RepID=A0A2I0QW62_9BACI|nr:thiamine diphosphokinase [Halalkalibacillus sediminis]PKR78576.1 thiamine diphosphokinase [Halalkalibacillus sediminis]